MVDYDLYYSDNIISRWMLSFCEIVTVYVYTRIFITFFSTSLQILTFNWGKNGWLFQSNSTTKKLRKLFLMIAIGCCAACQGFDSSTEQIFLWPTGSC